jgi:hypothetical protein
MTTTPHLWAGSAAFSPYCLLGISSRLSRHSTTGPAHAPASGAGKSRLAPNPAIRTGSTTNSTQSKILAIAFSDRSGSASQYHSRISFRGTGPYDLAPMSGGFIGIRLSGIGQRIRRLGRVVAQWRLRGGQRESDIRCVADNLVVLTRHPVETFRLVRSDDWIRRGSLRLGRTLRGVEVQFSDPAARLSTERKLLGGLLTFP